MRLIEALREIGIYELNDLQKLAIPKILDGRNVLIVAPTGSGKTECAVIPILQKMLNKNPKGITFIYITPLRALNRDILRRLHILAEKLGFSIAIRHGDTVEAERRKQSLKPPQILVTTPETFQILFLGKRLREALRNVKYVVIDEVHELAESERGAQLSVALARLKELTSFQIVGLSATVKNTEDVANFFGISEVLVWKGKKLSEYHVIKPEKSDEDSKLAEKLMVDEGFASEIRTIKEIVESHESALIFVNTRQTAEALGLKLKEILNVEVHHGSLSREARVEAEKKFSRGELKALICTSSMELGIDIGHVDVVIQFNSPREVNRLVQRVGRSGHKADRVSKGYIVASSFDDILESWVIVKKAEAGEIEETSLHEMSLDVLANQICAMALEYKEIDAKRCYEIIRRAYPFRKLEFEQFVQLCEFLANDRVIRFDGSSIKPTRKTRRYFYDNVSMIPDERRFKVVDITSGRTIGFLDESFVSSFEGSIFAMKGELWRIVAVNDVVKVEPVKEEGAIPSWVGEEIPVTFEVSQDVGKIRKWIAGMLTAGMKKDEIIEILKKEFRTNDEACREVLSIVEDQIRKGFVVPSDNHVTIEEGDVVVLNCCFGHKVNETLGRIIALLLSARRGTSVGVEIDPYRIKIAPAKAEEVAEILKSIDPESVEFLAERALLDTKLLQWKVVHCARKFGYLSKSTDITRINLKNFVLKLKDTPIYREAIREIFLEKMDIEKTKAVLKQIKSGEIQVSVYSEPSPISMASRVQLTDLLTPSKPTIAILNIFRRRIEEEDCILHCLNCGCTIRTKVKLIDDIQCIKCKSKLVACINGRRKLEEFSKRELFKIANLVMCYGKKAIYALNTYGIGAETAVRILSKPYRSDEEFFAELLEAEKRFIRTRRFWS
jgi:ATP-dependent Lhr-like helicase